jgi:hypothetical protein
MSTRSNIGIVNPDGTITAIYCHYDGYMKNGVGETLYKSYFTRDRVEDLIALGDIPSLESDIWDIEPYDDYSKDDPDFQYHFKDKNDFRKNAAFDIEYLYLFDTDDEWYVCRNTWKRLEDCLK